MSTPTTFRYHPFPLASGGFTTRVVRGAQIDETALTTAVAAEAGVPVEKCPLVLQSYLRRILAAGASGAWAANLYDLISFRPTSGGSKAGPDDFHTAADINADLALSFTAEAIRGWRETLALESMGVVGKITPSIDTIINASTQAVDRYTAGGLLEVHGQNVRFDPSDNTQGIFFTPAVGAAVRATQYSNLEPGSATVLVPAALSGPLTVRIAAYINGSVRTSTYTNPITPGV